MCIFSPPGADPAPEQRKPLERGRTHRTHKNSGTLDVMDVTKPYKSIGYGAMDIHRVWGHGCHQTLYIYEVWGLAHKKLHLGF